MGRPVTVRPVTPDALVAELVAAVGDAWARASTEGRSWLRVAVDGDPSTRPAELAERVVAPLRATGHAVARVRADRFWRAASLRLEHGREDPDAFLDWLDADALRREVLDPLGPGGSGRYLPSLRDPVTDRSTREAAVEASAGTVLVLDGALLLGRGLPVDLTVHLATRAATRRRVAAAEPERLPAWTLPAYDAYAAHVSPERTADVVVRYDDPRHPALALR